MSDPDPTIARIDALTRNARNTWFLLLAALAFVGITLMGVQHIDFWGVGRETELPLVNVSVPTRLFFAAAPLLIAAIYGYFHLYLLRLWEDLLSAPAKIGERPLGDVITPWLVTDAALHLRRWRRQDESAKRHALEWPAMALNFALAWVAGLVVLWFLWTLSMPARTGWITLIAGLSLVAASVTGYASARALILGVRTERSKPLASVAGEIPLILGVVLGLPAVLIVGHSRTVAPSHWVKLAPLNLLGQDIMERPAGWMPYTEAQADYRVEWCGRKALAECGELGDAEDQFKTDWQARRAHDLRDLRKPDINPLTRTEVEERLDSDNPEFTRFSPDFGKRRALLARYSEDGVNLREADLREVFLSGANLVVAQLQVAKLSDAVLNDADMFGAQLQDANLSDAQLQGAVLEGAQLQDADLPGAQLQGADLRGAQLQVADLSGAQLQDADLWEAQLQDADLWAAQLQGAVLEGAQLQRANLSDAQLQGAVLEGAQLQDADLSRAQLQGANLEGAELQVAVFWRAQLQGAVLEGAQLQGADLRGAQLQGAVLRRAQLQYADLREAQLHGTAQNPMVLQSTNLSASKKDGGALRFVDFHFAEIDTSTDFRNAFLDASVLRPEGFDAQMGRPCQWATAMLDDAEFYGRWRGWVEAEPDYVPFLGWTDFAPPEYHDIDPIPPPEGCEWKTGPMPGAQDQPAP